MRPLRWLVAVVLVCTFGCVPPTPPPAASPNLQEVRPGSATARPTRPVPLDNGLVLDMPSAWNWSGIQLVNRATQRYLLASNGPLTDLPGLPGNGDVDAAALPAGRVVIGVQSFCRMSCSGPATETSLPLNWATAAPLSERALPSDRHELAVGFRWFDLPIFVVARWADDAPGADVAAIATVVGSLRDDPKLPATGEYRGWHGIGPLGAVSVGSVRLVQLPVGAVVRPPYQTYDGGPYYLVRGKQNTYAFASRPLVDQRCEIRYEDAADRFRCVLDGRVIEWSRFGRYLGPEAASDLPQHRVIVRDDQLWVQYSAASRMSPPVPDEAAER